MGHPGQLGPWELVRPLGRGGMGEVWQARDPGSGREVALKVLPAQALVDLEALARFEREGRALAAIDHPGIVRFLGMDLRGSRPWLALPLLRGGTLDELVRREGPLEPRRTAALGARLADALGVAHAAGVLHRDVKPENVLLDEQGQPCLTDFGLARLVGQGQSLTATGAILGTPGYMAPEQAGGARAEQGPASDVYGLGATLYFLLTGQAPFVRPSLLATLEALLREPPTPPSRLRPEVPSGLEAIVLRCLAKAPQDRWPSAASLGVALEGWLRSPGRRLPRPLLRSGLALAAGLAAAGLVLSLRRTPAPAPGRAWPSEARQLAAPPGGDLSSSQSPGAATPAPETAEALARRGLALARAGDFPAGLAELDRAVSREPSTEHLALRARVKELAGDGPGALADSEAALRLDPANALALTIRAAQRLPAGDPQGALEDTTRALESGPDPNAFTLRAQARYALGEFQDVVDDAAEAIALDPDEPRPYLARSLGRARLGDVAGALADADRAIELGGSDPLCFGVRGNLKEGVGDLEGAARDYERCLTLFPPGSPQAAQVRAYLDELRARLAGQR